MHYSKMNYSHRKMIDKHLATPFKSLMAILIVLCLGLQTGCFNKEKKTVNSGLKSGDIIDKDSPWFDSVVIEFDGGYKDKGDVEYLELELIGCTDKAIVLHYVGNYSKDSNVSKCLIDDIVFIDPDTGEELAKCDLSEYKTNGCVINSISIEGGQLVCEMKVQDALTGKNNVKYLLTDKSGTVTIKDKSELVFDENITEEYYIDGFTYSLSYDFTGAVYSTGTVRQFAQINLIIRRQSVASSLRQQ